MKFKTNLMCVLPVLAAVAITGSVYSTWVFSENYTTQQESTIETTVTSTTTVGELTINNKGTKLVFDQTTNSLNTKGKGVYFIKGDETSGLESCTYTFNKDTSYKFDYDEEITDIHFVTTIMIPKALAAYFEVDSYTGVGTGSKLTGNTGTAYYTHYLKASEIENFNDKKENGVIIFDYSNLNIKYKEGKEPTTLVEYEAMKTKIVGQSIKTTYSATLEIK